MNTETLRQYLDDSYAAAVWLCGLGIVDVRQGTWEPAGHGHRRRAVGPAGRRCAASLNGTCPAPPIPTWRCTTWSGSCGRRGTRWRSARSSSAIAQALPTLLQIFATSQYLSDLLVMDPEGFDLLRLTEGQPVARQALVDELVAEIAVMEHDPAVLRALRRFKRRETLRIAYGDIVREQPLRTVTTQISFVADAIVEAALRAAWRKFQSQRGTPLGPDGRPARFVVLGLGKLGGLELNYSSDIDLIFLCENDGQTDGARSISNIEFFDLVGREIVRLLTEKTELGSAFRVDLRLRPEGQRGPVVMGVRTALAYYDNRGRTWERQAYIKARPVAGDLSLGTEFLETLTPWIYRRYLSHADISGIKALKRRIEQHSLGGRQTGTDPSERRIDAGRRRSAPLGCSRRRRPRREDRPRRHPRHRVRDPVSPVAQRRRSARAAHRQHPGGAGATGAGRLPDEPRTIDPGRELRLSAEDRASVADHARSANPPAAREPRRAAQACPADGLCDHGRAVGAGNLPERLPRQDRAEPQDSRPPAARRLQRRPADAGRGGPRARSRSAGGARLSRSWASTPSAT